MSDGGEIIHFEEYARLQKRLLIDKLDLDTELIDMPGLLHQAIEGATRAITIRDEAKRNLDYVQATQAMDIRNATVNTKTTEATIAALTISSTEVQEALTIYDDTKAALGFWNGMVQGMEAKQSSLKALVQLASLGYFTSNSANEDRRADIARTRKRLRE